MLMRPQSAVYKCIIPVKKPVPPSGAIYHSLFSEPREGAQTYPFPAWPEIDDPHQPCCLPTLMRAVYFEHHGTGGDFKADVCRSVDYWNKVIDSEIRQQIHALVQAQEGFHFQVVGRVNKSQRCLQCRQLRQIPKHEIRKRL